jgi:hypothetical protein
MRRASSSVSSRQLPSAQAHSKQTRSNSATQTSIGVSVGVTSLQRHELGHSLSLSNSVHPGVQCSTDCRSSKRQCSDRAPTPLRPRNRHVRRAAGTRGERRPSGAPTRVGAVSRTPAPEREEDARDPEPHADGEAHSGNTFARPRCTTTAAACPEPDTSGTKRRAYSQRSSRRGASLTGARMAPGASPGGWLLAPRIAALRGSTPIEGQLARIGTRSRPPQTTERGARWWATGRQRRARSSMISWHAR